MAVDGCNLYSAVRRYGCYMRLSTLYGAPVVDVIFAPCCCFVERFVVTVVESLSLQVEGGLCVPCNMGWSGFAMQALQRQVSVRGRVMVARECGNEEGD